MDLIYFIPGAWGETYHRKHVVDEFALHPEIDRVLIIEFFGDLFFSPLFRPKRFYNSLLSLFKSRYERQNLTIFTPLVFLHFRVGIKIPFIKDINRIVFNWCMRRFFKREHIASSYVVRVYRPEFCDFIGFTTNDHIWYDCIDDFRYDSTSNPIKHAEYWEKKLINNAGLVTGTSLKLMERALQDNKNSFFIPNAANVELFSKAWKQVFDTPKDLQEINTPIAGYIGQFRDWIDFDLLRHLFKECPDIAFVFVGGWKDNVNKVVTEFKSYSNVYFVGLKSSEDLPQYLAAFDVAIIPNKMNTFNQSVVPYKLFEYLAAGRQIITTETSKDLSKYYNDYIKIAPNNELFVDLLRQTINGDVLDENIIRAFGKQQTWTARVSDIVLLMQRCLSIK